ncbi:MAG: ExeM/NucH family extracellular endonuclease, partial [Actinomycetales bacterium]
MSRVLTSRRLIGLLAGTALAAAGAVALPSSATAAPADHLVIDEAYLNGGSTGASYLNKFIEIKNPTDKSVDVSGWSLQYRPYNATTDFTSTIALGDRVIPAGRTLLVSGNNNASNGAALPTPDVASTVAFSGNANGGTLALSRSTTVLTGDRATVLANSSVVDLLGYGLSTTYEGTPKASGYGVAKSISRSGGTDTDDNAADFAATDPSPTACGTACVKDTTPPPTTAARTIAEIQGTGAASPLAGTAARTTGVVTATYPTGGFDGAYIQTEGSGGDADLASHTASDGVFVYSKAFAADVEVGDHVEVTGTVKEFSGLTELVPAAGTWKVLDTPAQAVKPATVAFPLTEAQRETFEGMLLEPQGSYTITDNYATRQYGEVGLAAGTSPLPQPTDVVRPRTPEYTALVADNARRLVTLDDGSSVNYLTTDRGVPVPWLTPTNEVRQGARATFTAPVVLDYRFGWKLQPTARLTGTDGAPATFSSTRTAAPEPVGGQVTVGSFNVLNYFPTTGEAYVASGRGTCTYYDDRAGNPITNDECTNNGPRGAATAASLARQQVKIVKAFSTLDADIVAVEELENSAALGQPRDAALNTFVAALNAHEGKDVWAGVVSPATVPTSGSDVIRTAFVYKKAAVSPVGGSTILDSPAFANARA